MILSKKLMINLPLLMTWLSFLCPPSFLTAYFYSLLCKKNDISESTIQAFLESIDLKTHSHYSEIRKRFYNWINISENTSEINRSLICDFLVDMYNKGERSLNSMRSPLNFFHRLAMILLMILYYFYLFYKKRPRIAKYIVYWPVVKFLRFLKS